MVQRVLEQQQPLSEALLQLRRDLIPPDAEISTMNKFVEIMKPFAFVDMTEGIGGEKWVTILSVRPLIQKITCFLQTSHHDHSMVKEMKQVMLNKIDQYYGEGCDLGMLDKAMLLDPRFKNVSSDILIPELVEVASNILSVPSESQSTAESTS